MKNLFVEFSRYQEMAALKRASCDIGRADTPFFTLKEFPRTYEISKGLLLKAKGIVELHTKCRPG